MFVRQLAAKTHFLHLVVYYRSIKVSLIDVSIGQHFVGKYWKTQLRLAFDYMWTKTIRTGMR